MRDEFNRNQNAAFKAQRVSKGNCIMGFVPIGGQPPIPIVEHDGQKSQISDKIEQIINQSIGESVFTQLYVSSLANGGVEARVFRL